MDDQIEKKLWEVKTIQDGFIHVVPINDLRDHSCKMRRSGLMGETIIYCDCKCLPRMIFEPNKKIVVHDAFDGRLGVEWANEILKQ